MKALLTLSIADSWRGQPRALRHPVLRFPDAPSQHHFFWTLETKINTGILAGLVCRRRDHHPSAGLSGATARRIPSCVLLWTRGTAGQAAGSALGFGAGLGTIYLLHKTNHHKGGADRDAIDDRSSEAPWLPTIFYTTR